MRILASLVECVFIAVVAMLCTAAIVFAIRPELLAVVWLFLEAQGWLASIQ